jgi:hypothetical protein
MIGNLGHRRRGLAQVRDRVFVTAVRAQAWRRDTAARLAASARRDDGDVPGWVMVTLMTAGLVLALYGVAEGKLTELFEKALDEVSEGR